MNRDAFQRAVAEIQRQMSLNPNAAVRFRHHSVSSWVFSADLDGEPPLVPGSVYGIRTFRTTADYKKSTEPDELLPLTGMSVRPWRPGWNIARCPSHPGSPAPVEMHCMCGFHAFTKPPLILDGPPSAVTAIVQGAGPTVEAALGFRSQRARVVAFVLPGLGNQTWNYVGGIASLFVTLLCLSSTLDGVTGWADWMNLGLALVNAWFTAKHARALFRWLGVRRTVRRQAHAFDVPVFSTRRAAVAAFPLGAHGPDGAP